MANLIGSKPNQVSTNQMLGGMAFQSPGSVVLKPKAGVSPKGIGELCFELVDNVTLNIKVKGFDSVVRTVTLTLV